jgi:hypothetical protein
VVSALRIGASRQPTVVYSGGTANVLHAMDAHRIRKLAAISAVPAGHRAEQPFLHLRNRGGSIQPRHLVSFAGATAVVRRERPQRCTPRY